MMINRTLALLLLYCICATTVDAPAVAADPTSVGSQTTVPKSSQDSYGTPVLAANSNNDALKTKRVDDALSRWISKDGPGAAVMVIRDHDVLYQKGFGLARLGPNGRPPITEHTNFRLASLTKQFTGMAIAILVDKNLVHPTDRLTDFFPEQTARAITVDHLLHHTSGLNEYSDLFQQYGMIGDLSYRSWLKPHDIFEPTNGDVLKLIRDKPLNYWPAGRVYNYNNTEYVCLASIIERVSKLSYAQFLKQNIFDKLGMRNTYVGDGRMPPDSNLAFSYDFQGVGTRSDIDYSALNKIYGQDGVFSNLQDLYKWDQALHPEAKQLVSDEKLLEQVFRPGLLNDGTGAFYGYGWMLTEDGSAAYHNGIWLGYRTYIARYLNERFTIVVLSNYASFDAGAVLVEVYYIYHPAQAAARAKARRPESGSTLDRRSSHSR
jgi:CubicO group peptidase (beta-lactamase class C family)